MSPTQIVTLPSSTRNRTSPNSGPIGTIRCVGVDPDKVSTFPMNVPTDSSHGREDFHKYQTKVVYPSPTLDSQGSEPTSEWRVNADTSYGDRATQPLKFSTSFSGKGDPQDPSLLHPLLQSGGTTGDLHAGDSRKRSSWRAGSSNTTTDGAPSQRLGKTRVQLSSQDKSDSHTETEGYVTLTRGELNTLLDKASTSGGTATTAYAPPDATSVSTAASNSSKQGVVSTAASVLLNMGTALATQMVVKNAMDAAGKHVVGPAASLLWVGGKKAWDAGVASTAGKVFSGWWG